MPKNPHADFSPVLDGYSGIGAFRFWCQTALPLTYDDSLSYYELLNKVVNYLNHTIEDLTAVESNTSALAEAYNQLQKYVNDYFDDIDIEAELRNVLDAMAEDGTLDALLDPLVENRLPGVVDEKIDDVVGKQIDDAVAGQINESVAEQLPALVSEEIPDAVSGWLDENVDPVGSAVMVDGTLSIGGAAADAKVTGNKLSDLKSAINGIVTGDYIAVSFTVGTDEAYIKYEDGTTVSSNTACATDFIDVSMFTKIKYKRTSTTAVNTQAGIAFYREATESSYISGIKAAVNQSSIGYLSDLYEVTVPSEAKYARFTMWRDTATYGTFALYGLLIDRITDNTNNINELTEEVSDLNNTINGMVTGDYIPVSFTVGTDEAYIKYEDGTTVSSNAACATDFIDVSMFTKIKYKRTSTTAVNTQAGIAFYREATESSYISGIKAAVNQSSIGYLSDLYEVTVPSGAKYARFTMWRDTATYGTFALYGLLIDRNTDNTNKINELTEALQTQIVLRNLYKGIINASGEMINDRNGCYCSRTKLSRESIITISENAVGNLFFYDGNNAFIGKVNSSGGIDKVSSNWLNFTGTVNIMDYAPENATSFIFTIAPTDSTVLTEDNFIEWANNHYTLFTENNFAPIKVRFATYNTGNFSGDGISGLEVIPYYQEALSKANCDILATQEDVTSFSSQNPYLALYSKFFITHQRMVESGNNKFDCCSNQILIDITKHQFSSYSTHPYYFDYVMIIAGKTVHIINIHLDWYDKTMRATQISEIMTYISDFKYVVVIGDFNPFNYVDGQPVDSSNPSMYEDDFEIWTNAGYNIANGGCCGTFDTVVAIANRQWYPCDNIVTSKNIKIKHAGVVSESWMNDHKILYADVDIL